MDNLLDQAVKRIRQLPEYQRDEMIDWIIERLELEEEAAWEERLLTEAFGDALLPDGSIDFEKLHARGIPITLDELCPEGADEDEEAEPE